MNRSPRVVFDPMHVFRRTAPAAVAAWLALGAAAFAQAASEPAKPKADANNDSPAVSSTHHEVKLDGKTVAYTATAGWMIMKDDKGKPNARFGFTAYTLDGVSDLSRRPVTFAFNGGPGSSSIWLHLGILGPRRVVVNDGAYAPPPPAQIADNPYSPLDVTDLVMIDPVGTGFSKPLGDAKGTDFWGVDPDIQSVGAFIRRYVNDYGRWGSPKYILGESYGGIRSAGVVQHLQAGYNMNFNGVIMVSPFLSVTAGRDGGGVDLPHVLFLPTLAATAWYHDAIADKPASLDAFVADAERFALNEYAPALMKGYAIGADEKRAVAAKLGKLTGTSAEYWEKADLRVSHMQFLQELQRNKRLVVGRIDSRFVGHALDPLAEAMDYDPFFPAVGPAYTAAFFDYLRNELKFPQEEEYKVSAFAIQWEWKHRAPGRGEGGSREMSSADLVPDLANALTMNPGLNVLVQQGRYDAATPFFATEYNLDHLDVDASGRKRIRIQYYEAGHMMYIHEPSAKIFRESTVNFIRDTCRL